MMRGACVPRPTQSHEDAALDLQSMCVVQVPPMLPLRRFTTPHLDVKHLAATAVALHDLHAAEASTAAPWTSDAGVADRDRSSAQEQRGDVSV